MATTTTRAHRDPAPDRPPRVALPVSNSRLWFALVAGPLAWSVAELVGYGITSRGCDQARTGLAAYAVPHAPTVVVALAAAMAVLTAAGLVVALRGLRTVDDTSPPSDVRSQVEAGVADPRPHGPSPRWTRSHFMAYAGVLVCALLLANIILFGLAPLLVNACAEGR
jgi:hypothetical protein